MGYNHQNPDPWMGPVLYLGIAGGEATGCYRKKTKQLSNWDHHPCPVRLDPLCATTGGNLLGMDTSDNLLAMRLAMNVR
jgi:hypothetical protein